MNFCRLYFGIILLFFTCSYARIFTCDNTVQHNWYVCTASDEKYFPCLLNLIGSLHKHDFNVIDQVAVFDLGLTPSQRQYLSGIEKVELYTIEQTSPDLLKKFNTRTWGKPVPGWYAWKAVIVKQAFDLFPDNSVIFWIDAGTTILQSIQVLFEYTQEKGYFFHNGSPWQLKRETTEFVKNAFNMHSPERSWLLSDSTWGLEAGFMGVTNAVYYDFVLPMYKLTYDLRYFADDGTVPGGFGNSRHDLTLFSIHALLNNYFIFHHFANPTELLYLEIGNNSYPFHIACNACDKIPETNVYCARFDINPQEFLSFIQFKKIN